MGLGDAAGAAAAIAAVLALSGCGATERVPAPTPAPRAFVPAPTAVEPSDPAPQPRHTTAELVRRTPLRARPGGRVLRRLGTRTEFGSASVLSVSASRGGWLRVATPLLRNHRRGWIRASATRLLGTDYDIRIDRSRRSAALRRDGRVVLRFSVAVGRPGNETPLGRFAVTDKLKTTDATSPYGCCALALTGHQPRLVPGWPGGDRLAIHGTPAAETIGQAVSLGCLRAPTTALRRLMRRVPLGMPVVIRA